MNSRIFFLAAGGFAVGIFFRSLYVLGWGITGFVFFTSLVFFCAWFFSRRFFYLLVGIIFFAAALGMVRVSLASLHLPNVFSQSIGKTISLTGTVVAAPSIREKNQQLIISVLKGSAHTNILAITSLATSVLYGEKVRVYGKLTTPKPFATEHGRTFRYDRYLAVKGVFALMQHSSLAPVSPPVGVWVHAYGFLINIKKTFLRGLGAALPEPAASLAGGLVAGGTQGLGKSLLQDFIRSGLIHIVVLSGYNVMIVAETVLAALATLSFLSRKRAAAIASLIIGAFVLAAGAGAASIRAGIMAMFALLARATGRTYDVTRILVLAALLMLLWNPLLLAYSIGFDLSVVATLGLILGVPILEPHLSFIKSSFLRETAAATMTAQIAVLPLLLYVNGLFSLVALPANLLVLPAVPITMAASAVAGIAGLLVPLLAPVAALPAYVFLSYIIRVVHDASTMQFSAFAVPSFSFVWVAGAYAILALFLYKMIKNKKPIANAIV